MFSGVLAAVAFIRCFKIQTSRYVSTFEILRSPPTNSFVVRRQLTPELISSLPGTAGLPSFISFSTSYPEPRNFGDARGPQTQRRIQPLLERELQRESDFENRWPALPGTLLEASHGKVASYQAARCLHPAVQTKGLIHNETTASATRHGTARGAKRYIYRYGKVY